jgi:ABC-2 type transport system permease protein
MNFFKEIYKYRELLKTNVQKDIRGRYKNSFLGVIWSFFNPLLQLLVYALIFPLVLVNTPDNYVIFICVALIPWTYFTTTVSQASYTIIGNGNIVKKVYFPREILPISVVTSGAVNFIISTIIIVAFLIIYGMGLSKYIIFYPLILLIQYILLLGISFIISSITVYFRDLEHIVGIVLMAAFYATPIFYSEESIPQNFKGIINFNPMAHIIYAYRNIFYYQKLPNFHDLGIVALFSLAVLFIGYFIFKKLQKGFAEEL